MNLRPYQERAVAAVQKEWSDGNKKTLLVAATGTGKTIILANIAKERVDKGGRVLILAHRGELLTQAQEKLEKAVKLDSVLEKAESHAGLDAKVVVASIQTLYQDNRLLEYPADHFDTVIVDEAHHCMSPTYQKVLSYFDSADMLGVTATPDRNDTKNIGTFFDSMAFEYGIADGIKDGFLSPIRILTLPVNIDLNNVGIQNGDFMAGDLGNALEPYLHSIAEQIRERCHDRKTVVFMPLVSISQKFCDILCHEGLRAVEVNGNSKNRTEILKDFEDGKYDVLINAILLTEGFDCPDVSCIVNLRATRSRALYTQIVGRGLRLAPGKKDCLVLDFLWHSHRHELCHPACVMGESDEITDEITRLCAESGEERDFAELRDEAEESIRIKKEELIKERERKLAQALKEQAKMEERRKLMENQMARRRFFRGKSFQEVDNPNFEYNYDEAGDFEELYVYDNDLALISTAKKDLTLFRPMFKWEMAPATDKQLSVIANYGISVKNVQFKGQASEIIDVIMTRRGEKLASLKQIKLLNRYHFKRVRHWTAAEAAEVIDKIANNHWKLPASLNPHTYAPDGKSVNPVIKKTGIKPKAIVPIEPKVQLPPFFQN